MRVSMNVLLDAISRYRHEIGGIVSNGLSFQAVSLLPRTLDTASVNNLYICRLSEALRAANLGIKLHCMCIRDRIKDEFETPSLVGNLVIVNENLELQDLFCEVQDAFTHISNWRETLQHALITQKSMQDILSLSEPIIGNFISISDSALALIAYTKNIPTTDPVSLFLIENGHHSEATIKKFRKLKRYDTWTNSDGLIVNMSKEIAADPVVSRVFSFNETYFMHVVMSCNHREPTPGLLDLFDYLSRVLSYYAKKDWEEEQILSNVYNSLFRDLMNGKLSRRSRADERARIIGITPDDEYAVMLLTEGMRENASFPENITHEISQMFSCVKPVHYNLQLLLFLHSPNLKQVMDDDDIWNKLNAYFQKNNVYCGVSDFFNDLLELPTAYLQAETALSGNTINYDGYKDENALFGESSRESNIAHFNAHFISCLLDKSDQAERLWKSSRYGKMLLKLHKNDVEKNANNLEVLYTYLMHDRRASDTAATLEMHRNNIVYRISRIEETYGLSFDYIQTRLNVIMAFLMLKRFGFDEF